MCGKFTAMFSWSEVVEFSQPLDTGPRVGSNDDVVTYRPMNMLPVIILDHELKQRRIVPMRWGFPHAKNPRVPQPIHAGSETIDTTAAFWNAFMDGQRGIVVMRTFNEGKEMSPTQTEQWTIDPGDGVPRGFVSMATLRAGGIPGAVTRVRNGHRAGEPIDQPNYGSRARNPRRRRLGEVAW